MAHFLKKLTGIVSTYQPAVLGSNPMQNINRLFNSYRLN